MRILLAHNSTYYPGQGGGDKSNRLLMEALAGLGHSVSVVSRTAGHGPEAHTVLLRDLARRDVPAWAEDPGSAHSHGTVRFTLNGVDVRTLTESPNMRGYFTRHIQAFRPDVILASTDDSAQILLRAALDSTAAVIYLARATIALPFGPDCAFPSQEKAATLAQADGIVGVSQYVADYIRRFGDMDALHVPISLMTAHSERNGHSAPNLGSFGNEFVTLINPCLVKGIDIFLGLADRLPDLRFAAVRSWGTTAQDLDALRARQNITVLDPVDDMDTVYRRTRVLLVPSIWAEARGRVVQEAMARGIPVVASDSGGIAEAKLGVPYLLPVRQICRFRGTLNEQMVPEGEAPPQDLGPWHEAIGRLTVDEAHWLEIAQASRSAALAYEGQLSAGPFEGYLKDKVEGKRPKRQTPADATNREKKLLALRLLQHRNLLQHRSLLQRGSLSQREAATATAAWLVPMEGDPGPVRLICFPYAAGGSNLFRKWPGVSAVLYPGREVRGDEEPIVDPEAMLQALMTHVAPKLAGRFAFFGHSMGAGLAFELARRMNRGGYPMPERLFVSAARAPRFRTAVAPDPSDDELLQTLIRMNPGRSVEALRSVLPVFKADTGLYRRYVYKPGELLQIPLRAYGGTEDPGVRPEHLEHWREVTSGPFSLRLFAGGHLFMDQQGPELLEDIRAHCGS